MIPNNNCIETFKKIVSKELKGINTSKKTNNMTKKECEALNDLKKDKSIVIKQADQGGGGGVVLFDRENYEQIVVDLLGDELTYLKLSGDPTNIYKKELEALLEKGKSKGILDEK